MPLKLLKPTVSLLLRTSSGVGEAVVTKVKTLATLLLKTSTGVGSLVVDEVVTKSILLKTASGVGSVDMDFLPDDDVAGTQVDIGVSYGMARNTKVSAKLSLSCALSLETTHASMSIGCSIWAPEVTYTAREFYHYFIPPERLNAAHTFAYDLIAPINRTALLQSSYTANRFSVLSRQMIHMNWGQKQLKSRTRPLDYSFNQYVVKVRSSEIAWKYEVRSLGGTGWERMDFSVHNDTGVNAKVGLVLGVADTMGVIHDRTTHLGVTVKNNRLYQTQYRHSLAYNAEQIGEPRYTSIAFPYHMRSLEGTGYDVLDLSLSHAQLATAKRLDFGFEYVSSYLANMQLGMSFIRDFSVAFSLLGLSAAKERALLGGVTIAAQFGIRGGVSLPLGISENIRNGLVLQTPFSSIVAAGVEIDCKISRVFSGEDIPVPINFSVRGGVDIFLQYGSSVRKGLQVDTPLRDSVFAGVKIVYDLLSYTRIIKGWVASAPIIDPSPIVRSSAFTIPDPTGVKEGGIPLIAATINGDEGSYGWQGSFELEDITDLKKFTPHGIFYFTLGADTYTFKVDAKVLNRLAPANAQAILKGISPSAELVAPRAKLITKTWVEPTTAHAIILEVLGGYPADIQIINWAIPANRYGVESTSPMDIITQIATAVGGVVDTHLDGTLRIRPKYPVSVPLWGPSVLSHAYSDENDIYTSEDEDAPVRVYDKFRIMDAQASATGDRLEYKEVSVVSGEVRAYPAPWRTSCFLDTTSPSCGIGEATIEYRDEEETIEIYNGEGSVQYPILSVNLLQWMEADLLGVIAGDDSTKVTTTHPTQQFSLLKINYKTRCLVYPVSGAVGQEAQFLLRNP